MLKIITLFVCCAVLLVSAGNEVNGQLEAFTGVPIGDASTPANVYTKPVASSASSTVNNNGQDVMITGTDLIKSIDSTMPIVAKPAPSKVAAFISAMSQTPSSVNVESSSIPPAENHVANATTVAPVTTSQPVTTPAPTTISPPVTTAQPATTTPATPVPNPSTGKWNLTEGNKTCIIVQMTVQFNITYNTTANTTAFKLINIPGSNDNTTRVSGKCGKLEQILTLSWNQTQNYYDYVTLHFVKNDTAKQYSLHHLEAFFAYQEFPQYNSNQTMVLIHNASQFTTGVSNSYRCLRLQKVNLVLNGTHQVVANMTVSELQFQAFRTDNSTVFGLAKDCAFDTPDVVPIAVGCALAGLVIIILIAYLVGRRRSQSRGYLSM